MFVSTKERESAKKRESVKNERQEQVRSVFEVCVRDWRCVGGCVWCGVARELR